MKLIGYCRVSSRSQEDNTSLDSQEDEIRAFAAYKKHELVEVLREAKSGADTNRRKYQKMLDLLSQADGLVVTKLDRLGRSVIDLLELVEKVLKPQGKALIILSLDVDTSTPQGTMILTMLAAMAEMERSLIKERCASGRAATKAAGKHYGGGELKYGWDYDKENKKMVKKPSEQKQIARMVEWCSVEGLSCQQIADRLNEEQVPTKLGSVWTGSKVSRLFKKLGKDKPIKLGAMAAVKRERQSLIKVSDEVKTTITELAQQGLPQWRIAEELNKLGLKSIKGGKFDQGLVCRVRQIVGC